MRIINKLCTGMLVFAACTGLFAAVPAGTVLPSAGLPGWRPDAKLAKAIPLYSENAETDQTKLVTVRPGGRVVYAVRGPLNLRSQRLTWCSAGALKLAVIRPGTCESIRLGETLLWDERDSGGEPVRRTLPLQEFTERYPKQRGWHFPVASCDNLYFITVTPALDQPIRFGELALEGEQLGERRPEAAPRLPVRLLDREKELLLEWPASGGKIFDSGLAELPQEAVYDGTRYRIAPLVLNRKNPAFELPLGVTAGRISFLHTAGPQPDNPNPLLASYLLVYEDDSTESVFAVLRWNCGVFRSNFLKSGKADYTWWGPPGYAQGAACYIPRPPAGIHWNTLYAASVDNPYPEKRLKSIQVRLMSDDNREFALLAVTLCKPEWHSAGLIEPDSATFDSGRPLGLNVMLWGRDIPLELPVEQRRRNSRLELGRTAVKQAGGLGFARLVICPETGEQGAGPVMFCAGPACSDKLGLMSQDNGAGRDFLYTMIAGGGESKAEFERIRRLGFDAVKVHIPWREEPENTIHWDGWKKRFSTILSQNLKFGLRSPRNNFTPEYMKKKAVYIQAYAPGHSPQATPEYDPADGYARSRIVNYYRAVGELAAEYPEDCYSINANYGITNGVGRNGILRIGPATLEQFRRDLANRYSLAEVNRHTGLTLDDFSGLSAELIRDDKSRFLLAELARRNVRDNGSLQREAVEAIRAAGFRGHLTFNTAMHPLEHVTEGKDTAELLRLGRDFPPGSIFHETSDRYCLSFWKWMLALRTFHLPYGDEGNQNPPTFEHNTLSFLWMGMMQCYDSLYCQWYGGRPAAQNIARLKPFHDLLRRTDYLPDPLGLAFSFAGTLAETPDTFRAGSHARTMNHYGLANTLRALNINPDRYVLDEFPDTFRIFRHRLLVDDVTRSISPAFGDAVEKFMRSGGCFLATIDTDSLNKHSFFVRFGITVQKGRLIGSRPVLGLANVTEKRVGAGKLVILNSHWNIGWEPVLAPSRRKFLEKLFRYCGGFSPRVRCDTPGVFITPYRAKDGKLLLYVINITAAEKSAGIEFHTSDAAGRVFDLGAGEFLPAETTGIYRRTVTTLEPLSGTLLSVAGK